MRNVLPGSFYILFFCLAFCFFSPFNILAQADTSSEICEYPGGISKLRETLKKYLIYPESAQRDGINGKCYVKFTVDTLGNPVNVAVQKSLRSDCDSAAIEAVKHLSGWKPARFHGKKVNVPMTLPVKFNFEQKFCNCDSIYGNIKFSGFCYEYLNLKFNWVSKRRAKLKRYILYEHGVKSPVNPRVIMSGSDKIVFNNMPLLSLDSIMTLNGIYIIKNVKNRVLDELSYKNGLLMKQVHMVADGRIVLEIVEFDYLLKSVGRHYTRFKYDKTLEWNEVGIYKNGKWQRWKSDSLLSPDITKIQKILKRKGE